MAKLGDKKQFCSRNHDTFICGRIKGQCTLCKKEVAHTDYTTNKDTFIERAKQYRASDRERDRKYALTSRWRSVGIINPDGTPFTHLDYDRQYQVQGGHCAACGLHQMELQRRLSADHDHKTNKFRGLLCINCNSALGNVDDNIELLTRLISYVKKSQEIL